MLKRALAVVFLISLVMPQPSFAADSTIGGLFKYSNSPVRVYIKDVADESEGSPELAGIFRDELECALAKRQTIKFELVDAPAESDIQIEASLKRYRYTESAPLKSAAAEISAEYKVIYTNTGRAIWSDILTEHVKQKMSPSEAMSAACAKISRTFILKCFGRAHRRDPNRMLF